MYIPTVDIGQPLSLSGHPTGMHPRQRSSFDTTHNVYIRQSHIWRPPTDVYETDSTLRIQIEIGGMEHSDFAVVLEGRRLRVSGIRSYPCERRIYHQLEIQSGEFLTEVELPVAVAADSMQADYEDGFLIIEIRKELP